MKKRKTRRILSWALLACLALGLALLPGLARRSAEEQSQMHILSARAETDEIRSTLSGGGVLTAQESETLILPDDVELSGLFVTNGEYVRAGQTLATVDRGSAMTAILKVREALDKLEQQIQDAELESRYGVVRVMAPGRVKAVYARYGDVVPEVMLRYGALAVISLDGKMLVTFETAQSVSAGQPVTVTLSDGSEYPGRVESYLDGTARVTLTDDGPALYDEVTVAALDGTALGGGTLEVHSAWNAVASSGSVSYSDLEVGDLVSAGTVVVWLENMELSGEYRQLIARHGEYSERLALLFSLWQDGEISAPCDGFVSGLDSGIVATAGTTRLQIALLDAAGNHEYVFYEVTASEGGVCTGKSVPLSVSQELPRTLLLSLGQTLLQTATQTGPLPLNGRPGEIYVSIDGAEPVKISTDPSGAASAGGFASFSLGGVGGFVTDAGGGESGELYTLREQTLCSVTPHETMTVTISVDEQDILLFRPGLEAEIRIDALPERVYAGTVTWVGGTGRSNGGSSKFEVELTLPADADMLPGMNASVEVLRSTSRGLLIPTAALNDRGSECYVYTSYDSQSGTLGSPVPVIAGASDGEHTMILSGLDEGQTVWYESYGAVS